MILDDLRNELNTKLLSWAKSQGLQELPAYALEEPPAGIEADVACNLALLLAKPLKKSPRALAEELQKTVDGTLSNVDGTSIAGVGFLNFTWKLETLQAETQAILNEGLHYGRRPDTAGKKILVEFVSANPTGPLHVGHGRGAALGDSLALILQHLGCTVEREYYVNDAGHQVDLLVESVQARCRELLGKEAGLPPDGYHGEYVKDIASEYLKSYPDQVDDKDLVRHVTLHKIQRQIRKDLADFGVVFDTWKSESEDIVKKKLVETYLEQLQQRGFIEKYEDAVWFVAPGEMEKEKDKNRVLRRRDGTWTYFATDVAYHANKFERGYDRLIDIWGADHHGYVPRVKGSMQALGYDPARLHVVLYQLVSLTRGGVPVSMSKRSGDFITLREVLDEVGRDACRFFFALRGPNTALDFDLELAKKHTVDNPVYYLQYAHARISSIYRQGGATRVGSPPLHLLVEKEERELMKRLALFPQVLVVCSQEDSPHPLANYLLQVARQFHYFYDKHRVLSDNPTLTQARLGLLAAVQSILQIGLGLLGVSAPESM